MQNPEKVTREEIIEYYDQAFENSDHLRDSDASYRWILNKLNPEPGSRLLDVACGLGVLVYYAHQRGVNVYGIDISQTAAVMARKENPESPIFAGDGEFLPFPDGYFDYITNTGSLEHFLNPERGIKEMQRVMKPGALAAIFLPNSYYLVDILWRVWRTGYSVTHRQLLERFATYNEWGDLIKSNGFQIVKGYKYNHLFPTTLNDIKWHRKHPRRIFLSLLAPFIPFNLSYHFLYLCKKNAT